MKAHYFLRAGKGKLPDLLHR